MAGDGANQVVGIGSAADIVAALQEGRALASQLGFSPTDLTVIATAISEVARNILEHAGRGEIRLSRCQANGRSGVCVVASDLGPGIGTSIDGAPSAKPLAQATEIGSADTTTPASWRSFCARRIF